MLVDTRMSNLIFSPEEVESTYGIKFSSPEQVIQKPRWGKNGKEEVFRNDDVCIKRLFMKTGRNASMEVHYEKEERFKVLQGEIAIAVFSKDWCVQMHKDPGSIMDVLFLEQGDSKVARLENLVPHQTYAVKDSVVLEISSHHSDCDTQQFSYGLCSIFQRYLKEVGKFADIPGLDLPSEEVMC
jgi:hypothetical protein